jgi:hypothetical protein
LKRSTLFRFWQLERARRTALMEAAWSLAAAQIATRLLPFRWLAPRLGRLAASPAAPELSASLGLSAEQALEAQRVGWAVQKLARYLPWDARCLAQAVAAQWMLRRRGLPGTLYLGVDRGQERWLEAHAWLRCGGQFVTGEPLHERFKVIAAFRQGDG